MARGLPLALTILLTGVAGAGPSRFVLRDTTYRLTSAFGPETLLVRELTFASPTMGAEVDFTTGTLVVSMGRFFDDDPPPTESRSLFREQTGDNWIIAYDLRAQRVEWSDRRRAYPIEAARRRVWLQQSEKKVNFVRLPDGRDLFETTGDTYLWPDGVWLNVSGHDLSQIDSQDATVLWRVPREVSGYVDGVIRRDSVFYLVADGIQRIDGREGSRWAYPISGSRKNIYNVPGGGTIQASGGGRAVAMTSPPLIDDRDLYFAADTVVLRLDSRTGAVRWRRELHLQHGFSLKERALGMQWTPQFLGRLLIRDAGENIAVSSLGWASGAKFNWLADPPTFALLSKADGNVLGRVGVPGVKFLYDAQSTEFGHFLIANDRVLALDDQPSVRATYRAPMDLQPLGGFVELGSQVIVTTASGLAALSADSLKVQWVHRCGRLLAQEGALDWAGAHYIVTTQGLLRLDPGSGARPAAYYPLRGTWARFTSNGVILGAGQTLRLVVLPSPSERMHQD